MVSFGLIFPLSLLLSNTQRGAWNCPSRFPQYCATVHPQRKIAVRRKKSTGRRFAFNHLEHNCWSPPAARFRQNSYYSWRYFKELSRYSFSVLCCPAFRKQTKITSIPCQEKNYNDMLSPEERQRPAIGSSICFGVHILLILISMRFLTNL